MSAPPTFRGFGPRVSTFFDDLAEHNERDWFLAHKAEFLSDVKEPFEALLDALEPTFGPGKLFRINRDIRFSADKSPYKTAQAAIIDQGPRGTLYVQVSATGAMIGAGAPHFDPEQLRRYREAVAGDPGEELTGIIASLKKASFIVGTLGDGEVVDDAGDLKRVPRPYPPDHPRGDLLKLKRLVGARSYDHPAWLQKPAAVRQITTGWHRLEPIGDWLAAHVGAAAPRRR